MKVQRFRQKVTQGQTVVGHTLTEFATRGVPQLLDAAGLDFVLLDMEHASLTTAQVADVLSWCRGSGLTPLVRVPHRQGHLIGWALDAGALGILAPHVETAEEARGLVGQMKYAPQGQRGVALFGPHTAYRTVEPVEHMAEANRQTLAVCMIESEQGLAHAAEIADTPGVDMLWVGYADLTQSLGLIAQHEHPRVVGALQQVVDAARRHGLPAGIQARSVAQARTLRDLGFGVIAYATDVAVYGQALTSAAAALREPSLDAP
ncbi:MAG: hypothetical protein GX605_04405 [Chloroflexi bacterium]|nr:hypothetical protein [Chloroflexota bacterium]